MSDEQKTVDLPDDVKAELAELKKLREKVEKIEKAGESSDFEAKLKANNGETAALARQQHSEIQDLRAQLTDAKSKIPGEGAVVLTGAKARDWAGYQELGKLDEVKAKITQGEESAKKAATYERNAMLSEVAGLEDFKPGAFTRLAGDLKFEVKSEDIDGKPQKVAYVTHADGKAEKVSDYATREWADFMPSLKPETQSHGNGNGVTYGGGVATIPIQRQHGTPLGGGHTSTRQATMSAEQEKAIRNQATAAF